MATATFEFGKAIRAKGSNRISVDVTKNGRPFGQLWTYEDTDTDTHPWQAKVAATGDSNHSWPSDGEMKVKAFVRMKEWISNQ